MTLLAGQAARPTRPFSGKCHPKWHMEQSRGPSFSAVDPCDTRLRFYDCAHCTSTDRVRHPRQPSKWGRKCINTPRRESLDGARGVLADPARHHPVVEPEAFAELHHSATLWTALRVAIHRPTRIAAFGSSNRTHWWIPRAGSAVYRHGQPEASGIDGRADAHADGQADEGVSIRPSIHAAPWRCDYVDRGQSKSGQAQTAVRLRADIALIASVAEGSNA